MEARFLLHCCASRRTPLPPLQHSICTGQLEKLADNYPACVVGSPVIKTLINCLGGHTEWV